MQADSGASGRTQNVTDAATWSSSNTTVATIDKGLVTSHAYGAADIKAVYDNQTAIVTINVTLSECDSGPIAPTGSAAGFGVMRRYQGDWRAGSDDPDYSYYNGHTGGAGQTLEYLGCSGGNYIWLQWAFNGFVTVAVRAPWQGSTDRGLRIGDDPAKFHSLYPNAHPADTTYNTPSWPKDFDVWVNGPLRVVLKNGQVYIIEADWWPTFDGRDPDTVESTNPTIGPCGSCVNYPALGWQ
ncbi:MAG: Ig-like domain-containing protein [Candidatus Doudnabacteria bacterium]